MANNVEAKLLGTHNNQWSVWKIKVIKGQDMYSVAYCQVEEHCFRKVEWKTTGDLKMEVDCEQEACKKIIEAIRLHYAYKDKPETKDANGDDVVYVVHQGRYQWVRKNLVAKF